MISPFSKHDTFSEFRSKRHELAWLSPTCADLSAAVNFSAQVPELKFEKKHLKVLNGVIKRAHVHSKRGITQQCLDCWKSVC